MHVFWLLKYLLPQGLHGSLCSLVKAPRKSRIWEWLEKNMLLRALFWWVRWDKLRYCWHAIGIKIPCSHLHLRRLCVCVLVSVHARPYSVSQVPVTSLISGTKSMPARKNPVILFQCRDSSGCDFSHQMTEFSPQGQYHYPGLDDSPEQQNLCLHAKIHSFYFNGETPLAVVSCTKWHNSVSRTVWESWTGWQCWWTKSKTARKNPGILFECRECSGCDF